MKLLDPTGKTNWKYIAIVVVLGLVVGGGVWRYARSPMPESLILLAPVQKMIVPKQDEGIAHLVFGLNDFEYLTVIIDNKDALTNPVEYRRNHCNWNIFEMAIKKGYHTLKVINSKTKTVSEKNFTLNNEAWFFVTSNPVGTDIQQGDGGFRCE